MKNFKIKEDIIKELEDETDWYFFSNYPGDYKFWESLINGKSDEPAKYQYSFLNKLIPFARIGGLGIVACYEAVESDITKIFLIENKFDFTYSRSDLRILVSFSSGTAWVEYIKKNNFD